MSAVRHPARRSDVLKSLATNGCDELSIDEQASVDAYFAFESVGCESVSEYVGHSCCREGAEGDG